MLQSSNRFCPNCGTSLESEQRFCPNCGSAADITGTNPTQRSGAPEGAASSGPSFPTDGSGQRPDAPTTVPDYSVSNAYVPPPPPAAQEYNPIAPPPPPVDPYPSNYGSQYPSSGYPATGGNFPGMNYPASTPSPGSYAPTPTFPRPQQGKPPTALIIAIVAVLVIIVGGAIAIPKLTTNNTATGLTSTSQTATAQANNSHTPSSSDSTPTASDDTTPTPVSTEPKETKFAKPLTFSYASVKISIISIQQALKFDDDTGYYPQNNPGILRLNVKESNNESDFSGYYPTSDMNLVFPTGSISKAEEAMSNDLLDNGVNRDNWIDFSVPLSTDASTLILRVGSTDEQQVEVPLKEGTDLSKYQPQVFNINKTVQFGDMKWTVTKVTTTISYGGNQAKKNQVYIILNLTVDNTAGSEPAIQSPYEYLRLKSGETVASVKSYDGVPITFEVGSKTNCSASFLVPASSDSTYTFQLLGKQDAYWPAQTASLSFALK